MSLVIYSCSCGPNWSKTICWLQQRNGRNHFRAGDKGRWVFTTSIFSSSFSFFSFSFFLALAVMERTAVDTYHVDTEQRCFDVQTKPQTRKPAMNTPQNLKHKPFHSQYKQHFIISSNSFSALVKQSNRANILKWEIIGQESDHKRNEKQLCGDRKPSWAPPPTFSFSFSLGISRAGG